MNDDQQLSRADLAGLSPEQIEAARHAGRLDALLRIAPELTEARSIARRLDPISRDQIRVLMRAGHHDLVAAYSTDTSKITD